MSLDSASVSDGYHIGHHRLVLQQQTETHGQVLCTREGLGMLAWLQRKPPDLEQGGDGLLFRGMQHNGDAAHDAEHAAHDPKDIQALLQDHVRQHSAASTCLLYHLLDLSASPQKPYSLTLLRQMVDLRAAATWQFLPISRDRDGISCERGLGQQRY